MYKYGGKMLEKNILEQEMNNAISWIKQYIECSNSKGIVIGNSGGKDSATVLAMAVKAIGKENVLAVSMLCHSSNEDLQDANLVAKTFGVRCLKVDLTNSYDEMEKEINLELKKISINELGKESKVNMKPRFRMTTLYSIAQNLGYVVIGTGNLCEIMVGYTTKWGDSGSDFNPIGNFTVDEVLEIGRNLGVPEKILKKAPSDGLGSQTDVEKMGITYKHISELIETGKTDEVAQKEIIKRFNNSKHKRQVVPVYRFERDNFLIRN